MRRVGEGEPPIPVFEDVVKRYGSVLALDGVTFHVNRGEVVCLIGPSGSGKSTLLRCANGLEAVDDGRVVFEGIDLVDPRTNLVQVRQRIGMVRRFSTPTSRGTASCADASTSRSCPPATGS